MKALYYLTILIFSATMYSQAPCDYSSNVTDSIGSYKSTKDFLMYERVFAGTSSYAFFSLALTDGMPTLNIQFITKSKDFIKANCLDKNSRLYLQLDNGKIITLMHIDEQYCGTSVMDSNGYSNLILTGVFMFVKNTFEDLKSSPISQMRVKYSTAVVDYIIPSEFTSEMDQKVYNPQTYFIKTLDCILN